eukprot:CAMPEP_0175138810 /NCGR_PEP_ID=MMETSP0087-20121206/10553_1 /TAXON_ID=136419 /ORGANISM="Unknown Unknown, Strain D1" /LENGTH=939 /DNA_ID=CAMNT_0016421749 /DNA_START=17 /DNA_END=2836 /DNA_ORIENTATION=-
MNSGELRGRGTQRQTFQTGYTPTGDVYGNQQAQIGEFNDNNGDYNNPNAGGGGFNPNIGADQSSYGGNQAVQPSFPTASFGQAQFPNADPGFQPQYQQQYQQQQQQQATFQPIPQQTFQPAYMGGPAMGEPGMAGGGELGGAGNFGYNDASAINRDNMKSKQVFTQLITVCSIIAVVCFFLSFISLGWGGGYVAFVMLVVLASFALTKWLTDWMFTKDDSHTEMRKISGHIRDGAEGYLTTQYTYIVYVALVVAGVLFVIYLFRESPTATLNKPTIALLTSISFLIGAGCSALAGYLGVWVSVRCNIRVAIAASRFNYQDSLLLCFRGGAIAASLSASLCILGITVLYLLTYIIFVNMAGLPPAQVPMLLAGYGFGASFVALFMQLGGGIYTKAADVGADMCGKIEAGIPEDDPRNPAVIADLVGDNVGDCAGSMADVFESIAAEMIGTMILGSTLAHDAGIPYEPWLFFPLLIHAFDLVVSGAGIVTVKSKSDSEDPLASMKRSYGLCMVLAIVGFFIFCRVLLYEDKYPNAWWHYGLCGIVGNACSYCLVITTQYYTDYTHGPVKGIAKASLTGHGTNVIAGVSVGLESTGLPVVIISAALLTSYALGNTSGLPQPQAGIFGTALATMGMLCTAVFVLSMNNFGPIADNAGGIVEMSGQPEAVRVITDRLDAVGNVTKAAAKGYAVGGSALACFVLFQAFLDEITLFIGRTYDVINVAKVEVVVAGLIGIMMILLFAGWSMAAVGRTAEDVVWEVRRQFQNKPGIMQGTELPDYNQCVTIVTKAALKEMRKPALLALGVPVFVGFFFRFVGSLVDQPMLGVEAVAGFMLFGSLTGLVMAIFLDNAGGAWDNAKKLIESQGQKNSEAHKAAVTGDTVGDPFKDTAGPSLHVIITTMSTTILVLGPMFIGSLGVSGNSQNTPYGQNNPYSPYGNMASQF